MHFKVSTAAKVIAALSLLAASHVRAETMYGLTTGGGIFQFDSATPGVNTPPVAITGTTGYAIVGMDVRPATGQVYVFGYKEAVTSGPNAQLYTLNPTTGVATVVGSPLALAGAYGVPNGRIGFDFNPVSDAVRVIFGDNRIGAGNDANFRLNPVTGALIATDQSVFYAASDPGAGNDPVITGAAYNNNFSGAAFSTLYGYDFPRQSLVKITVNPGNSNDGQLNSVGFSGLNFDDGGMGFDISGSTGVAYLSGRVSGANGLYTVNLVNGNTTLAGLFTSLTVLDIAAVPEPGTSAVIGIAGLALFCSRFRRRRA